MAEIRQTCEACKGTCRSYKADGTQRDDCLYCLDMGYTIVKKETFWTSGVGLAIGVVVIWAWIGLMYLAFFPALFGW